jgi:ATP/ADP translocase
MDVLKSNIKWVADNPGGRLPGVSRGFIQVLGAIITTVTCHILNFVKAHDHILATLKEYEIKLLISVSQTQKTIRSSKYLHFLNIFIDCYNRHSSVQMNL